MGIRHSVCTCCPHCIICGTAPTPANMTVVIAGVTNCGGFFGNVNGTWVLPRGHNPSDPSGHADGFCCFWNLTVNIGGGLGAPCASPNILSPVLFNLVACPAVSPSPAGVLIQFGVAFTSGLIAGEHFFSQSGIGILLPAQPGEMYPNYTNPSFCSTGIVINNATFCNAPCTGPTDAANNGTATITPGP